ncbi:MAG: hypothetical protein LC795_11735 [Acidobacteria bacterium]|nr:hypothetical protein [Acidobacteriota bacterium]
MVVNADGTGEQVLATRGGAERFGFEGPAWSPDGNVIAAAVYADGTNMTVAGVSVADGTVRPLTPQKWLNVYRLAWLRDGSGLVFSAADRITHLEPARGRW